MDRKLSTGLDEEWRHGWCHAMASAMARANGWSLGTLTVTVPSCDVSREQIVHAWGILPSGEWIDAGGIIDEAWIRENFLGNGRRCFWNVRFAEHADEAAYLAHMALCYGEGFEDYRARHYEPVVGMALPLVPALDGIASPPVP